MFDKVVIELGKNRIKIVRGKFNKKLYINNYFEIDINGCSDWTEDRCNEKQLGSLLLNMFNTYKLSRKNVAVVLSCLPNLLLREMVLPYTGEHELYNIIKFEAKDYFPVDFEHYLIDYKVAEIIKDGKSKKQRVLAVVVPKNIIEKIDNISRITGIDIRRVDIEADVFGNLIKSYDSSIANRGKGNNMVLHVERDYLTTTIIKDGLLSMSKTFVENMDMLLEHSEDEESGIDKSYIIDEVVENVMKVASFYITREGGEIEKIYVLGDMKYYSAISDRLKEKSGLEVINIAELGFIEGRGNISKDEICSFAAAASGII